jgi:hypothetical protein
MEDLMLGSGGPDFIVTKKFLSIWDRFGFAGLAGIQPINKVLSMTSIDSEELYGVDLPSNGTRIDSKLSNVIRDYEWDCELCEGYDLDAINGVVFEKDSLSSHDIFKCINANIIGLRSNARLNLLREGLKLSNLVPAAETCWSFR